MSSTSAAERYTAERGSLLALLWYFLKLGTVGFGGPVALAGYMHRDLVERRRWLRQDDYDLALALAQVMPGPRREGRHVIYELVDKRVRNLIAMGERLLDDNAARIMACRVIAPAQPHGGAA